MEAPIDTGRAIRFGPFELDTHSRELRTGTTRVRLQDQPFEILHLLLERPGEVVTREALRRRLWPDGTFVDFEHSLNAAIKRLRAALGDDADNPRFVETLPRRGYRFIAPHGDPNAAPGVPGHEPPLLSPGSRARAPIRLAVLPFSNLSDDPGEEYFSDGLTEEMIAQIGCLCRGRVGVLARWSSMVFKGSALGARQIGDALRADYLLEGSVRREGDRVRITARLVEAAGETHLWSESYERDVSECCGAPAGGALSVQTDVATRIARSLAMELAPAAHAPLMRTAPPAAHQAYLKGRYHWNLTGDQGLDRSIAYFEQAVAAAPAFAAAYAGLARAQVSRAEHYRECPRLALEAAQSNATRAIELDSGQCDAFVARADAARMLEWDWAAAADAYAHAQALNPSFVAAHRCYAVMLAALKRHGDAVRASERALELDPLCLEAGTGAAWIRYVSGDAEAAIDYCRNTLDMDPSYVAARRTLGASYLLAGRHDEALAAFRTAAIAGADDPVTLCWLAHATAMTGDRDGAQVLITRVRRLATIRHVPGYHLALACTAVGDRDAAFAALDEACLDRDPSLGNVAVEPRFEPLRSDSRFGALVARLGL